MYTSKTSVKITELKLGRVPLTISEKAQGDVVKKDFSLSFIVKKSNVRIVYFDQLSGATGT